MMGDSCATRIFTIFAYNVSLKYLIFHLSVYQVLVHEAAIS